MRFLPLFVDLSSGLVAVVGTGPDAQNKLRLLRTAGANVRWFTGGADVTAELVLLSNPPGRLEVSSSDPLQADFSEFVAVVSAGGVALDDAIAACGSLAGKIVLGETPADIQIRRNFTDNAPFVGRTNARARLDAADAPRFGVDVSPYAKGPADVALEYVERRSGAYGH